MATEHSDIHGPKGWHRDCPRCVADDPTGPRNVVWFAEIVMEDEVG